ncbi:MAG: response regulator transcription factor [Hyphomicrobium sp.]|nr:response regulator transcription factor [Hyphomicrobium sp.]
MPPTISIVDDDLAVLDAVSMLLIAHSHDVACFSSAETFLDAEVKPGCVVSDVRMPNVTGMDLLRRMRARGDERPVILLTGHGDIEMAVQAMKLGAHEFLEKPFDDHRLLECIGDALRVSASASADGEIVRLTEGRYSLLTDRQRDTMKLLVRGMANKQIAIELGISPRTVEIHRTWVMNKMAAKTLADLVRMGLQLKLI